MQVPLASHVALHALISSLRPLFRSIGDTKKAALAVSSARPPNLPEVADSVISLLLPGYAAEVHC